MQCARRLARAWAIRRGHHRALRWDRHLRGAPAAAGRHPARGPGTQVQERHLCQRVRAALLLHRVDQYRAVLPPGARRAGGGRGLRRVPRHVPDGHLPAPRGQRHNHRGPRGLTANNERAEAEKDSAITVIVMKRSTRQLIQNDGVPEYVLVA